MKKGRIEHDIEIVDLGAKGKVIGKKEGQAYLCTGGIPGDIVSMELRKMRKGMPEGVAISIDKPSPDRITPVCDHFKHCGGCSWQDMRYEAQTLFKEQRVREQIRRISGAADFETRPILASEHVYAYRNKLEFTFVEQRWLTPEEIAGGGDIPREPGTGFHVPGRFDWVLHIDACHLQDDRQNAMRRFLHEEAQALGIPFFNPRSKEGVLRNVVFRNNSDGNWMVLLIVQRISSDVNNLATAFQHAFPEVKSLWLIHNDKVNDSYSDCPATLFYGDDHLIERLHRPDDGDAVNYRIGPKSFFQTNTVQANRLYNIVYDWANLSGKELVYDLYTGTGSIALFVANKAQKVVGVEYVPEAIEDAKVNATLNGLSNTAFFAGDMKDVLTPDFIREHGQPDVLITDPPRAGMHEDVITRILECAPRRIVYVSCDPATQARDIQLLQSGYRLVRIQPVDMFPHTSHVENVALLERLTT